MSDDVIWHCIRHNHCSFMAKITTGIFCRNPYNATGICNRSSCPLANSRYATIRDHDGIFYLYMKTAERAHLPNKLWERVKLPRNYEKAMDVINKHLEFWPKLLVHKIKQRLTKMTQYRIRMRKLQLKVREKVMTMPRKQTQRDLRRLEKAEKAAQLDKNIESELKERLRKGVYGDIFNVPYKEFDEVLDMERDDVALEEEDEEEGEVEYVEGDDMEEAGGIEDMEDFEGLSDGGTDEDDVLDEPAFKKPKGSGSDLKRNAGKRSRKVTTEVMIARYNLMPVFLLVFPLLLTHVVAPIFIYSARYKIQLPPFISHVSILVSNESSNILDYNTVLSFLGDENARTCLVGKQCC